MYNLSKYTEPTLQQKEILETKEELFELMWNEHIYEYEALVEYIITSDDMGDYHLDFITSPTNVPMLEAFLKSRRRQKFGSQCA